MYVNPYLRNTALVLVLWNANWTKRKLSPAREQEVKKKGNFSLSKLGRCVQGMGIQFPQFLSSALDGRSGCYAPACLYRSKSRRHPLCTRLSGVQSRSGRFGE